MRAPVAFAAAVFVTFLTACSTDSKFAGDPFYDAGIQDGCSTGTAQTPGVPIKPVRDKNVWDTSEAYRAGWKRGYADCTPGGRGGGDIPGSDRDIGGR